MLHSQFIETDRLLAIPLDSEQLELYLQKTPFFEDMMGLTNSSIYISEEVEELLREAVLPRLKNETANMHWFTNWIAIVRSTQQIIGDFCFYDAPDAQGLVEVGYGVYPSQQKKGYMHELMKGIIGWAREQEGVRYLRARTERTNVASIKLLSKSGFICPDQLEDTQFWYYVI